VTSPATNRASTVMTSSSNGSGSTATSHSRSGRFSIGEVLEQLRPDFPGLHISKIRYLETEGLVSPERTPAGYRKFSADDVARLRYVLTAQREHYLPLKVIREHLDAMDRGLEPPELPVTGPQVPRVVLSGDGMPSPEAFAAGGPELRLSRAELVETAGIDDDLLQQLVDFGMVRLRPGTKYFDGDALVIAKAAGELASYGLEPRHLRAFKTAADREVGLVQQVSEPLRRQRDAGAQARAEEAVREIAALSVKLHATLVKSGLQSGR
jgi:DNA-binding transcriptional MerR regulator